MISQTKENIIIRGNWELPIHVTRKGNYQRHQHSQFQITRH